MAFPHDLLDLSQTIADLRPNAPHQASLRRAVSTAYYALFHLLISEATANWVRAEFRATLARCFDHGPMKNAALQVSRLSGDQESSPSPIYLRTVAEAFVQAQQRRNEADYNTAKKWTNREVNLHIASVKEAFDAWAKIRDEPIAQEFLVSLLATRARRQIDAVRTVSNLERDLQRDESESNER